uniref:Replication protein A subunit n=2 Tax=Hordeum vulgare subsp. vulgare TaxID=112509 RepID=M0XJW7_HORVV
MTFHSLSDVSPASRHWSICVRVARMWDYCGTRDGQPPIHVDLVLVDEKGNHIYAEIPGNEATKFKQLVEEQKVYCFKKFLVVPSKASYKPFPAKYMIRFTPWTTVVHTEDIHPEFPMYVYKLMPFSELPSRVGAQDFFVDVIGQIVGVSQLAHVRMPTNTTDTPKRVIALRDNRNTEMKIVLWGQRAVEFEAQLVYDNGQNSPVIGIFVGLLMKSYNNDETLSGGSACRWYLNEDIPEIDDCFERLGDDFPKIQWISNGAEKFAVKRNRGDLPHKSVDELRNMDPWETENTDFLCTVTITKVMPEQPWWFQSCSKCHRSATSYGSEFRCSAGCVSTKAYPKFRLFLEGTDGTGAAEFVFFNRVAQQLVGKSVMALLRSSGLPREIAAVVSQKYTLAVSVTQKSLSQRNISFQVNGIETFLGRQNSIPHDTRAPAVMPVATPSGSSRDHALTLSTKDNSVDTIPELPIVAEKEIKKTSASRVPLRHLLKRKATDGFVGVESSTEFTPNDASSDGTALLPITLPMHKDKNLEVESTNEQKRNKDKNLEVQSKTLKSVACAPLLTLHLAQHCSPPSSSAEELTVVSPSSADDPTPPKKSSAEELTLVSPTSADDPTPPKKSKMDNTVVSPSDTGKSRRRPVAANKEN